VLALVLMIPWGLISKLSWCPLKHFERREGIVYPDHHKKFFGPDEIEAMRQTLMNERSVSSRKALW